MGQAHKFTQRVEDANIEKTTQLRQKKFKMNQKLDDAAARRHANEAYRSHNTINQRPGTVIDIPVKPPSPSIHGTKVISRLSSYQQTQLDRATLERRLQDAESRREQLRRDQLEKQSPSKERQERFAIKRIQLLG